MSEFNTIFGKNFFPTKEDLGTKEPNRTLIFAWKGLAKNWKVYLDEQKRQKEIQDQDNESYYYEQDIIEKVWGRGGNDY